MTPDLKQLQELLAKASYQPWHNDSTNHGYDKRQICGVRHRDGGDYAAIVEACNPNDADLIVAAVNALPALLASHEALSAEVAGHAKQPCKCACHDYPQHHRLQDALEALQFANKQLVTLRAEVAGLRKDAERLDWLQENKPSWVYRGDVVEVQYDGYEMTAEGPSVRAAIDAARQEKKDE